MLQLISPQDMLACEKNYFASSGVPSLEMMERAGQTIVHAAMSRFQSARLVHIACGPGGNGGDGYVAARMLQEMGIECRVFCTAPAKSTDAVVNAGRAAEAGVPIENGSDLLFYGALPVPDVWIDCIYGTGLSRAPEGEAARLIRQINEDRMRGAKTVSADIPSGLNGRTGQAYDPCVCADVTVALEMAKYGHFLQDGMDLCGEIDIRGIGFPESIFPENLPLLLEARDLRTLAAPRPRNIHKGKCGHLLVIAGSLGMAGAAALCAKAALRSGVGLVTIACPESIISILQNQAPCAMCIPLPERGGAIAPEAAEIIRQNLSGKTAIAMGCGLSRRAAPQVIRAALESGLTAAIDADALNLIAGDPELKALLRPQHVLTPHPGEAARLLGYSVSDPVADAKALSRLGATAVLKGASRVIAGGRECYISASGSCGMARGGSGDVLCGLMGALLAEPSRRSYAQTAAMACELHGLAGECAQRKYGPRAMNAADLIEFLPEVFQSYVD